MIIKLSEWRKLKASKYLIISADPIFASFFLAAAHKKSTLDQAAPQKPT